MDEKGQKTGVPIKASRIGKDVGHKALMKKCEKAKAFIKANGEQLRQTKATIRRALQEAAGMEDFHKRLEGTGIRAVFRINEKGRIYGASFIDENTRLVFNGSTLGKEFSAARFHEKFIEHKETVPPLAETEAGPSRQAVPAASYKEPGKDGESRQWEEVLEGFDLLSAALETAARSDEWEEDFKVYRPRKKKRRRKL